MTTCPRSPPLPPKPQTPPPMTSPTTRAPRPPSPGSMLEWQARELMGGGDSAASTTSPAWTQRRSSSAKLTLPTCLLLSTPLLSPHTRRHFRLLLLSTMTAGGGGGSCSCGRVSPPAAASTTPSCRSALHATACRSRLSFGTPRASRPPSWPSKTLSVTYGSPPPPLPHLGCDADLMTQVFGFFTTTPWEPTTRFIGNGECFVFRSKPCVGQGSWARGEWEG